MRKITQITWSTKKRTQSTDSHRSKPVSESFSLEAPLNKVIINRIAIRPQLRPTLTHWKLVLSASMISYNFFSYSGVFFIPSYELSVFSSNLSIIFSLMDFNGEFDGLSPFLIFYTILISIIFT